MAADLVLLHGFTHTGRSWEPVRRALAGRYRALAPDLPGHGAFAGRRPASFAACAAYLGALPGERLTLCGYSMGGRVALHAALGLQSRLVRLVLIGPLELPQALSPCSDQVERIEFVDWRRLPFELARLDVCIAPLVANAFNHCKSDIKWMEASLVRIPTVASPVGQLGWSCQLFRDAVAIACGCYRVFCGLLPVARDYDLNGIFDRLRPVTVDAMTTSTAATTTATIHRTQSIPALPLPPKAL